MSSQNGSQISTKPSDRQPAEEKASGSEQSAPVNSQAASDIRTDPMRQVAFSQFSLADDFPSLDTLRQTEQPAARKSTRHSPIAHGASSHSQKSQASSKKSANNKSADAANKTSSTSFNLPDPDARAFTHQAQTLGMSTTQLAQPQLSCAHQGCVHTACPHRRAQAPTPLRRLRPAALTKPAITTASWHA